MVIHLMQKVARDTTTWSALSNDSSVQSNNNTLKKKIDVMTIDKQC